MASNYQEKVIEQYERKGYYVIKLIKTNKNGIGDLLCLKSGEPPLFIECKEKTDTVKPLQTFRGKEVQKYGCKFKVMQNA